MKDLVPIWGAANIQSQLDEVTRNRSAYWKIAPLAASGYEAPGSNAR